MWLFLPGPYESGFAKYIDPLHPNISQSISMKKCKMVSVFAYSDVNTREVGRTRDKRKKPRREAEWFPAYVNTETILHFFYKITNERGTKTVFTYAHVKWFYGQSERTYYLNYFIISSPYRSLYIS